LDFLLSNQAEIKECPPLDGAEEDKYEENRNENQEKIHINHQTVADAVRR
jgi:hypothetical protein